MADVQRLPFPAWVVVPDVGEGGPDHPIVLPPEVEGPEAPRPSHPIFLPVTPDNSLPGEQPGIDNSLPGEQPQPEHPIYLPVRPDNTLPGDQPRPDQGLPGEQPEIDNTLPGSQPRPDQGLPGEQPGIDNTLPGDQPRPDQGLPGEQPGPDQGLPPFPDQGLPGEQPEIDNELPGWQPRPEHPIYDPVYPDNALPEPIEEVGELDFYQRKTIGINWDADLLAPSFMVAIYVMSEDGEDASKVRTVPNTGASSVTFPQDFTGERTFRVSGAWGYCEGEVTVE